MASHVTGQATLDRALRDEAISSTRRAELIALGVLFVLLLIGLRAPVAALVLTLMGAGTTLAGFGIMALLGKVIETDPIAVALASMTGLALGVGFALLILDRFREQEHPPGAPSRDAALAASQAVASTGRIVLFSGTALIVALVLAVAIAPTTILMSLGIGVLLCSALATGAAVVVLPAALVLLGPRIEAFALPAPRLLTRGWDWVVGRGRWVTRWPVAAGAVATAALLALAIPAAGLETGPPDITMLPASSVARQDFERVAAVMGPGWPTPYNVVVASPKRPITDPELLVEIKSFQRRIAADPRVDSVVGPGAFVSTSRDLEALPRGLRDSAKLLNGGKRDLGRLERGLGQAAPGRSSSSQAGQRRRGRRAAQGRRRNRRLGRRPLRAGIVQARTGREDLRRARRRPGRRQCAQARRGPGADRLARSSPAGSARPSPPCARGCRSFQSLATDVASSASAVSAAHGSAQAVTGQVGAALAALQSMTAGKQDPGYAAALAALNTRRASPAA